MLIRETIISPYRENDGRLGLVLVGRGLGGGVGD